MSKPITTPFHNQTSTFNNQSILTLDHKGEPYIAMKPLADYLGIDWADNITKINGQYRKSAHIFTQRCQGKAHQLLCLPLSDLPGFLYGTNLNQVKPEFILALKKFKQQCVQQLLSYTDKTPSHELSLLIAPLLADKSTI